MRDMNAWEIGFGNVLFGQDYANKYVLMGPFPLACALVIALQYSIDAHSLNDSMPKN